MASLAAAGFKTSFINGHSPRKRVINMPYEFQYLMKYREHPDPRLSFPFKNYCHFGMSFSEIEQRIRKTDADIFFIQSQFTPYHQESDRIMDLVKTIKPCARVVTGGCHATLYPEHCLSKAGADFVILGEGEESSVELLRCLDERGDLSQVPNLAYRNGSRVVSTQRRYADDIDRFPFPVRELLLERDFHVYRRKAAAMITSRGCPNRCGFCTVRVIWGADYRTRSAGSVVAEIIDCAERFGVTMINFEDDNLFASRDRATVLLEPLVTFRESSGFRLDLTAMNGVSLEGLDDDIVRLMNRAGFSELNISLMSHSPDLQRRHGRPFDSIQFARIAQAARKLGMNVRAYFILGLPGQTIEEVRETIAFLLDLGVRVFPSVYYDVLVPPDEWKMQRSSAFYTETVDMTRDDQVRLFNECRSSW
ncbi:MAG: hypothetical protein A2176_12420 [Spirochaetes bacterium RBG_13_51_14]|nr:MAG: hypothetical protein A2176_12420 [Spirochaetes bacterium RBG_13_51_14]